MKNNFLSRNSKTKIYCHSFYVIRKDRLIFVRPAPFIFRKFLVFERICKLSVEVLRHGKL